MLKSEYRIGSVWGIPIKVHISLLVLLVYLAISHGARGLQTAGMLGGLFSVLFIVALELIVFASIALHELGHSFVAIRKGCRVREITLMFIGGAAKMEQIPSRPLDEFLMAIAGPAVSLFLGAAFLSLGVSPAAATTLADLFRMPLYIAGLVNLVLAGFNLIPAFPMDGGRVFRAIMTPRHGRLKATYIASRIGRSVAVAFFIIGLFGLESVKVSGQAIFQPGNPFLILISIFIFITAGREYQMVQFEEQMKQRGFGTAWPGMTPPPPPSSGDDSVVISPPPYAQGPDTSADLQHPNDDNPFSRFFRR